MRKEKDISVVYNCKNEKDRIILVNKYKGKEASTFIHQRKKIGMWFDVKFSFAVLLDNSLKKAIWYFGLEGK